MSISLAYGLTRKLLGALVTVVRRDVSNDAELLVLRHENAVLRRQVERVRYEPQDRLWLAALSSLIPQRRWAEVFAVTPVTLLAWHRRLAAGKYTAAPTRPGRPELTQRSGRWWCGWRSTTPAGYRRVHGELTRLGHKIAPATVWGILNAAGIDPSPRRSGPVGDSS